MQIKILLFVLHDNSFFKTRVRLVEILCLRTKHKFHDFSPRKPREFTCQCLLGSYKAKKNKIVFLLSSIHTTVEVHEREKRKPKAILDYNKNKDEVDTTDEMLRSYSTKASSRRLPLAAFFNMLDIVSLNTYVISKDITLSAQNRRQFLIKLGKELCTSERSRGMKCPICFD